MTTSLEDILAELPADQRLRIEARSKVLIEDARALQTALDEEDANDGAASAGRFRFELYRDREGAYRFRLKGENGQVLFDSAPFPERGDALRAVEMFRRGVEEAQPPGDAKAVG